MEEKRNNGILLDEQRLKEVAEKHDHLIDYAIQNETLRNFWRSKIQSYD